MATSSNDSENPLNIDGNSFNADMYLEKILKHANLKQVMDKEAELVAQSQYLQSEMQTLVYENYNKFISATDTVRKMRSDFIQMQDEMNKLNEKMSNITNFSEKISESLSESGSTVSRLCSTRQLLDKLQFLFLLPNQLNTAINEERYADAVQDFIHAQRVLHKYGDQPSFQSIQQECSTIIDDLKKTLRDRLLNPTTAASELAESVSLLRQLQESDSSLHNTFLSCSETRLQNHLQLLGDMAEHSDLIEWVEKCNNTLLVDLGVIISCYCEMMDSEVDTDLPEFAESVMNQVFKLFKQVIKLPESNGTDILIRGLDKFFRKLQAMTEIASNEAMANKSIECVIQCIEYKSYTQILTIQNQFKECLTKVRQSLATKGSENVDLKDILNSLQTYLTQKVQASLLDQQAFLQNHLSFGLKQWCVKAVTESCWKIISDTMTYLAETVQSLSSMRGLNSNLPHELLLILAKLCLEMQERGLTELAGEVGKDAANSAQEEAARATLAAAGAAALAAHVTLVGEGAAAMLRVSLLARDWLRAPEPRGPRAVCRRVVEALAAADATAAQLFPAGAGGAGSESSRRTPWSRSGGAATFSPVSRLFAERVEVFGAVAAERGALAGGALRIALKALAESVRLRVFSRHGLQQLQVDTHFLSARAALLVPAAAGSRPLAALLHDALAAAQLRCVDPQPQLMDPSIVDIICERG